MATASLLTTINGGLLASGGAPLIRSQSYSQFIAFGDSNIDSGYFFTHPISNNPQLEALYQQSVAAGGGIPTDPGSAMNTTLLAEDLGLTAIPVGEPGGTNFAASGATVSGVLNANSLAPSIQNQISSYLNGVTNGADPNALYLISGGGNDARIAQKMNTQAQAFSYMARQAGKLAASIASLYAAGARHFLIDDDAGPGALKATFDNTLWSQLSSDGIPFLVSDVSGLIRAIDANPAAYGITNTIQPPAGPFSSSNPYDASAGGSVIDADPSLISDGWARFGVQDVSSTAADTYLWADDEHLSGAGQAAEAAYNDNILENAIPLPGEVLKATAIAFGEGSANQALITVQWQRGHDGQGWADIPGAATATYTVTTADVGDQLRVRSFFAGPNGDTGGSTSPSTYTVACYCRGTHLLTDRGEVVVENLRIGDGLVTAAGVTRPIKWIGHRSYCGRFANANPNVLPICFKAGSLSDNIPLRDLWVSPKHAMSLDGLLIPAEHLVNGITITQAERFERVDYFHIELDSHDVILAEGAASESFVDEDSRAMFHNAQQFAALYPGVEPVEAIFCAPRVEDGFVLEKIRRRLAERAGLHGPSANVHGFRGTLDRVDNQGIEGWAQAIDRLDVSVCLDILLDGVVVAQTLASHYRADLETAGLGSGSHCFRHAWDEPLTGGDHVVEVRRSSDGAGLWCSPQCVKTARAAA